MSGQIPSVADDLLGLQRVMAKASNPRKAVVGMYEVSLLQMLAPKLHLRRVLAYASWGFPSAYGGSDGFRRELA